MKDRLTRKRLMKHVHRAEMVTQRHTRRFIVRRIDSVRLASREIITWLMVVGALIAGLGLQLVVGQGGYMMAAPQVGGDYVEGVVGPINSLNPIFANTSAEASVSRLIFSSLYNYDATGTLHQDLATSMKISSSHTVYTVTIRNDAKWQDGVPLTTKDIVYTLNLIKNPAVRSPLMVNWTDVSVAATNDTTVVFTLPAPYAAFPEALVFSVLPEHLLKSVSPSAIRESSYSQAPVGSGPFVFQRLQEADSVSNYRVVHLSANSTYYAGAPKLDRFEIRIYPDENSIVNAMNAGELSGTADVSVTSLHRVTLPKAHTTSAALDSGVYLLLNVQNPLLKDVTIRKSLQLATNTAAIRNALGGGVIRLDGPVLNSQVWGSDVPRAPAPDVVAAQRLLDKAGWKLTGNYRSKDGKPLELTITTTKNDEFKKVLALVSAQWQKIGVKVTTNIVDTSNVGSTFVQNTLQGRNFDVLLYELSIGADPDVYAYWHSSQISTSGYNFSNYSNLLSDASLASARSRIEPELRNVKYKQFMRQWLEDVPAIALYQPVIEYVTNDSVKAIGSGAQLSTSADRYSNVENWTVSNSLVYKTP